MAELSGAPQPPRSMNGLAVINDFSPEWDYTEGGAKILVTSVDLQRGRNYCCLFGEVEVSFLIFNDGLLYNFFVDS